MFVGAAVGATDTRLAFEGGEQHYDFESQAVTAFVGYRTRTGWSFQGSVGAVVGGELTGDEIPGSFELGTGVLASVTGARSWFLGDSSGDGGWFVNGSVSLGGVRSPTTASGGGSGDESLFALDLRLGLTAGRTFAKIISPYLMARGFGGPVFWTVAGQDITGSDTSKFQLGAGVNLALDSGLSAVLDVSALGERSVSAGLSWQL